MLENIDCFGLLKTGLFGGLVIAITSFLASYMSTKIAAIVWSLPLTLLPSIVFMYTINTPNDKIGNFTINSSIGCINLITFGCVVGYILKYTKYKHDKKYGVFIALSCAITIWLIGAIFLYFFSPYD